ncbi:hypothetical protein ACFSRY_03760 [Pontibacter locisalis]|uniref:Sporulation protein YjcZ n=1 Tax=Pontibacter locisalis TaxID=1719035 RepID=A0ABW5IH41_9BACT
MFRGLLKLYFLRKLFGGRKVAGKGGCGMGAGCLVLLIIVVVVALLFGFI